MSDLSPREQVSIENINAANLRVRDIKKGHRGAHLPMPTDLEYAVMKLRSAAYAYNHGDKTAAIINAREAFILAAAPFTVAELMDAPSVQEYEALHVGASVKYRQIDRTRITHGDPAFGGLPPREIERARPGGIRGKIIGWLGG